jgi:hypothetical protein
MRSRPSGFDDERLAEPLFQPRGHDAGQDVAGAAGRIGHDHLDRLVRVSGRGGRACGDRDGGRQNA